jgi:micrococcal nuclease
MNFNRLFIFLLLILISCKRQVQTLKDFEGKVVGVKDGDTIEVLYDYKPIIIRLADVDCPENGQPFSRNAKRLTSDLCFNKIVHIISNGKKDRYQRLIATVFIGKEWVLNEELLRKGMAWHYIKYSDKPEYGDLEAEAREKGIGLWADENAMAPWEWRDR